MDGLFNYCGLFGGGIFGNILLIHYLQTLFVIFIKLKNILRYLRKYKTLTNTNGSTYIDSNGNQHINPYASHEWYIAPPNKNGYGGSPDAGDIYPYDAPLI